MFKTIEKTEEEKLVDLVNTFNNESVLSLDNVKHNYKRLFDMLWLQDNPQAFFDLMGNEAYKVFETAQKTVLYIMSIDPTYTQPEAVYEYTVNADGTVTVGDKIISEEIPLN